MTPDKRRRSMIIAVDTENLDQFVLIKAQHVKSFYNGYDVGTSRAENYKHMVNRLNGRYYAVEMPLLQFEKLYPKGIPDNAKIIEIKPIGDGRKKDRRYWDMVRGEYDGIEYGVFKLPRCIMLVKKGEEILGLLKLKRTRTRLGDLDGPRAKKRLYDVQAKSTFPKVKMAFERDNPGLAVIPQFSYDDSVLEYYEKQQRIIEYNAVKAGIYKDPSFKYPKGTKFKVILYTEIKVPTDIPNGKGEYMQKTIEFIVVDGLKRNQWADPLYTSRPTALKHAKKAIERFPHLKYRIMPIKPNTIRL